MDYLDETEKEKYAALEKLMADWKKVIESAPDIVFSATGEACPAISYFSLDGFFPGYFSQKTKVLFIGREPRYVSGMDRIKYDLDAFSSSYNPNGSPHWRRLFYIYYGIQAGGKIPFSEIPYPQEMVEKKNYGFSIMNISKYSNDSDNGATADYNLINRFLDDSKLEERNFIREEIELLDPDVIVSLNLWNGKIDEQKLGLVFPGSGFSNEKKNENASCWDFNLNGKTVKFVDAWHFSRPGSDQDLFYDPVMDVLFN